MKKVIAWLGYYLRLGQGPNPGACEDTKDFLKNRETLSMDDWYVKWWQSLGIKRDVSDFIYKNLESYLGIETAKIIPSDRIIEDLHFDKLGWPRWEADLRDDFEEQFKVDVFKSPDLDKESKTFKEFVCFLNNAVLQEPSGKDKGEVTNG